MKYFLAKFLRSENTKNKSCKELLLKRRFSKKKKNENSLYIWFFFLLIIMNFFPIVFRLLFFFFCFNRFYTEFPVYNTFYKRQHYERKLFNIEKESKKLSYRYYYCCILFMEVPVV